MSPDLSKRSERNVSERVQQRPVVAPLVDVYENRDELLLSRACDYQRVFAVPDGIDPTKIEARFTSGVLRVRLPKSELLRPRRIEIKAG